MGITGKNGVIVEIPGDDLTRFHVGFWNSLSRGVPNGKVRESIKMIKGKLMGKCWEDHCDVKFQGNIMPKEIIVIL